MTQTLTEIRHQLARLARVRRRNRWLSGFCVLACTALLVLTVMFAIDVAFELDRLQRLTVMLFGAGTLAWVAQRHARPLWRVRETETDLALMIEQQNAIDTDLVAAIEFARPVAACWGSAILRSAVIRHAEEWACEFHIMRTVDYRSPPRRVRALAIAAGLFVALGALCPQHCVLFFRRLALSNEHYPSRTQIEQIEINGHLVYDDQRDVDSAPYAVR